MTGTLFVAEFTLCQNRVSRGSPPHFLARVCFPTKLLCPLVSHIPSLANFIQVLDFSFYGSDFRRATHVFFPPPPRRQRGFTNLLFPPEIVFHLLFRSPPFGWICRMLCSRENLHCLSFDVWGWFFLGGPAIFLPRSVFDVGPLVLYF